MSQKKEPKGITWPWLITAWSFPVLIGALVFIVYSQSLADAQGRDILRLRTDIESVERDYKNFKASIVKVTQAAGYKAYQAQTIDPITVETPPLEQGETKAPAIQNVYTALASMVLNGEEAGVAQQEEVSPHANQLASWIGGGIDGGLQSSVNRMRADARFLRSWREDIVRHLAVKLYDQYYGASVVVALKDGQDPIQAYGQLRRSGDSNNQSGLLLPLASDLDQAYARYQRSELPSDPLVASYGLSRVTLQDVALMQRALIDDLADAIDKQYGMLYAEADGWKILSSAATNFSNDIETKVVAPYDKLKGTVVDRFDGDASAEGLSDDGIGGVYDEQKGALRLPIDSAQDDLQELIDKVDREIQAHDADVLQFQRLLQANKLLGKQFTLREQEVDGRVEWVDRVNKLCHINLGSDDNIHAGMRFEVHDFGEKGSDRFKGVVEVIRPLSQYYSLCVILDAVDEDVVIRENDALVNQLWQDGEYLKVALHGRDWGAPHTHYGKFRLEEMLRGLGVTIQDHLKPDTDLVILGKGVEYDTYYQSLQDKINVRRLNEAEVRLYIDPR